jgi:hypothetical protein
MSITIEQYLTKVRAIGENICKTLRDEVLKMGFESITIDPDFKRAEYSLSRDPSNGENSLVGVWRDHKGHKQGEILFHSDSSFFAEYDVIGQHPTKPQWFVEAVTAWGRDDNIKSEPRLLPVVTE